MNETPNYGLVTPVLEPDHYLLGASPLRGDEILPSGDWSRFLPDTEPQNIRGIETYNCTGFGTHNVIETMLRQRGKAANYSDRALGIAAGTSPVKGGNDPHVVAETIRKSFGAVDESVLPFDASVQTVTDYYRPNPLTSSIVRQGASWWNSFSLGHEWVIPPGSTMSLKDKQLLLAASLKYSPIGISVYAWQQGTDGHYHKPVGAPDNHWVALVYAELGSYWEIFDSYDGYIKRLAWDYDFGYAKVYYIQPAVPRATLISLLNAAYAKLRALFAAPATDIGAVPTDERLKEWCAAIQEREGWAPGSHSYRNNNPGNLRYSPYQSGRDSSNFSIFPTYAAGLNALMHQLRIVCNGTSPAYNSAARSKFGLANCSLLSIYQFYEIYAPSSDQNDPSSYANFVAKRLGVTPWTKIKDL